MKLVNLEPKIVQIFREGYSKEKFASDIWAGLIVGVVALPLSIAFAIASGVKPEQGLYTAVIAGMLISLFSGSRFQIGGPTGAFIVIIYGIVAKYGYDGLCVATLIAGVLLILMGLARLGEVIKFIPYPVTIGFTTGIALIIFSAQIKDFFGLAMPTLPSQFIDKFVACSKYITTINPVAVIIATATIFIIIYFPRITRKIPGSLVAIIISTIAVHLFGLHVETIGSRFGTVASMLPSPHIPRVDMQIVTAMFGPAVTIALLAGIESLLSAVVADGMMGTRHRSNMELVAQGIGNVGSAIFGGIPATGAIARTATNIKSGGLTPISGIIHAVALFAILVFFGKWASLIPMAALAGILVVVAWNMSELKLFLKIFRGTRSDIIVMLTTFLLTVFIDLTVAIEVGVVLAALFFMRRMIDVTQMRYVTDDIIVNKLFGNGVDVPKDDLTDAQLIEQDPLAIAKKIVPEGVEVFEIDGPFFFGAADKFKQTIMQIEKPPKILILRMRHVPVMDTTGLRVLDDVFQNMRKKGIKIILSHVHPQLMRMLENYELLKYIDSANIQEDIDEALERARQLLAENAGGGKSHQPISIQSA